MENNWKEKAIEILQRDIVKYNEPSRELYLVVNSMLEAMNLVFEATKKECVAKVKLTEFAQEFLQEGANEGINKDSILNINKPNL
jgi:hypothetical protein